MPFKKEAYDSLQQELSKSNTTLVAVSKTKPIEDLLEAYQFGVRDFGENYVQELVDKYEALPKDIRWHFIGHLQSNKVKYIAPFVHLIHGVDSEKLLVEINKQGEKNNRIINCLLQVHIASEETKFGFGEDELSLLIEKFFQRKQSNNDRQLKHINIMGLMGMGSLTDNPQIIDNEFKSLKRIFDTCQSIESENFSLTTLSMGMSGDYKIAINNGSNMIRIGSMLFGERTYPSK